MIFDCVCIPKVPKTGGTPENLPNPETTSHYCRFVCKHHRLDLCQNIDFQPPRDLYLGSHAAGQTSHNFTSLPLDIII